LHEDPQEPPSVATRTSRTLGGLNDAPARQQRVWELHLALDNDTGVNRRIRSHAYVCVLGDGHDTVFRALGKRRSQTRLSDITVPDWKPHRGAVEPQNEVLAYLHQFPPIWPQGAQLCADNAGRVKSARCGSQFGP
jgi:hypothetical protein